MPLQEQGIGAFASKYEPQPFEGEDTSGENGLEFFAVVLDDFLVVHWQKFEHAEGHRNDSATTLDLGCVFFTTFWLSGDRLARPQERSLEPLTEIDGDDAMMDNPGDDDAGETSAVKSKIQPMKPSDQEILAHEACGHYPYLPLVPRSCWWHWAVGHSQTTA